MHKLRNNAFSITVALLFFLTSAFSEDSASARGSVILQQARSALQAALAKPLQRSAQLIVLTASKPVQGTYTYANTGSLWRDEVVLPGYREVRVRSGNVEKIQRPVTYSPIAIYATFDSMRRFSWLQLRPEERVTRVKKQKISKLPAQCVEIEETPGDRTICVYDDGTLAALRTSTGWDYQYSDYSTFDKVQLPGRIRVEENGVGVLEIRFGAAQAITPATTIQDDIDRPTLTVGGCQDMILPRIDNKVPPHYPEVARQTHTQGTVDIYGIIEPDGTLKDLAVVRSAGSALDQASLDAVSQWKYKPATCNTTAVPTETLISVHYTLGP